MKPETIERLLALNAAFYQRSAAAFSRTRTAPWPGWSRLLDRFSPRISVLDLGCGNGRFFAELSRRDLAGDYLGVDTSARLIELAREAHPDGRFLVGDALSPVEGRFDLVVAFGLLHHLPSFELRRRFMTSLGTHRGTVCVTFWRFEDRPRFQRRMLPWPLEEREPGDHLLDFGEEGPRYCHHASDEEIGELIGASGLSEVDRYSADGESGDFNEYSVLEHR
jgi:SAM-dependent methyltransferase